MNSILFWILLMGTPKPAVIGGDGAVVATMSEFSSDIYDRNKVTDTKWIVFKSSTDLVGYIKSKGITSGVRIFAAQEQGLTVETQVNLIVK